ncbi:DUF305 domain-containing protein [Streptomyces qinzhouensis]|uniref:DUF305 domain-containing protein n=1 Tax=Streptomyces qinzhouensis TaxID=2599401 RepID=A0A5B8IT11_9ACTN|nr:DUF305 domain-containing protein [Streptomyces qinzhouensis]QDY80839.1 DUF305 domain-containing protein [Streptomyces qinzhouensis]
MTRTHWTAVGAVVAALLFAGAATVASAGNDVSAPRSPATDSADAGFARDMSVHHQQAVEMSFIVRDRTENEEVRRLAYDIINTQANQRGMMQGWLDQWGLAQIAPDREPMAWMAGSAAHAGHSAKAEDVRMPGMATPEQLERLESLSGKEAEIAYFQLMIAHHKGGVDMAKGCVELCSPGVERQLAEGMVQGQRSEIDLMTGMLKDRGARPRD